MYKVDLHSHTIASGHALNTVFELVDEAGRKGIEILGITEHGPAVRGAPPPSYFCMFQRYPHMINGVRVLYGIEANVIDEQGKLDLSDNLLEKQDIVLAGLHPTTEFSGKSKEANTKALIAAAKKPYVKIITHPYSTHFDVDIEELAEAACDNDTLLEINCSYFLKSLDNREDTFDKMKRMIAAVKKRGKKLVVNSDAHCVSELGREDELKDAFQELGLEEKDIINNDIEEVKRFLGID